MVRGDVVRGDVVRGDVVRVAGESDVLRVDAVRVRVSECDDCECE